MKLRELLKRFRLRAGQIDDREPRARGVDEVATELAPGPGMAPTNWVPSQQDERPRH